MKRCIRRMHLFMFERFCKKYLRLDIVFFRNLLFNVGIRKMR